MDEIKKISTLLSGTSLTISLIAAIYFQKQLTNINEQVEQITNNLASTSIQVTDLGQEKEKINKIIQGIQSLNLVFQDLADNIEDLSKIIDNNANSIEEIQELLEKDGKEIKNRVLKFYNEDLRNIRQINKFKKRRNRNSNRNVNFRKPISNIDRNIDYEDDITSEMDRIRKIRGN